MLEINSITKIFDPGLVSEKTALNGLNLSMADGDFVTIIGGNGAGKSSLLNAIAGRFYLNAGTITIDGVDITDFPEFKRSLDRKSVV